MEPFLAQILLFAGNFAIRGWATCEGQLLPISQNAAVFSLVGTTYGGDGRTTFGLPDLRGRTPIGRGNAPGLQNYNWGQKGGSEFVTLNTTEIPSHSHPAGASSQAATDNTPGSNLVPAALSSIGGGPNAQPVLAYGSSVDTTLGSAAIGNTGGNQSHENRMPYLAMYYLIALQGVFPSRS